MTEVAEYEQRVADRAFAAEQRIIAAWTTASVATWSLAEALYELHEMGGWASLGYDSLDEFLAQPALGISRRQFFKLTKMWRDLVVVRGVPAPALQRLGPAKVDEVVPAIMRGDVAVEDALSDAEHLGCRDLREKYRRAAELSGDPDDEPIDPDDEPPRVQCEACGSWYVVGGEE